jgi:hypothetical protein
MSVVFNHGIRHEICARKERDGASVESVRRIARISGTRRVFHVPSKNVVHADDVQYWSYVDIWLPNHQA